MSDHSSADPFAQFAATFFEECSELLGDLEVRLTSLNPAEVDPEDLHAIFRAIHSIKAGAGAFKFVELVEFSHALENLLDLLRSGDGEITEETCLLLVKAADIVADLVDAAREGRAVDACFGGEILQEIQDLITSIKGAPEEVDPGPPAAAGPEGGPGGENDSDATGTTLFTIDFKPHADLFRHANEPLLLVRELKRLGNVAVRADLSRLPNLAALDPEQAYVGWTFELTSEVDRGTRVQIRLEQPSPQAQPV